MNATAVSSRQLIEEYFQALSGKPLTEALMDRYISDPALKEHIRQADAAFPGYKLVPHAMVGEGDTVAVRAMMYGIHNGAFAGIAPTGKSVSAEVMLFYRVAGGRIAKFWMQMDMKGLMDQLLT